MADQRRFEAQAAAADAFRDTPATDLLTGLRGKDVILTFVESYGRDAVEDPEFAPQVGAVLDAGTRRLAAAGFASRSGFLTSPTSGGGSWLAHATLLSGLWIDNQQRYRPARRERPADPHQRVPARRLADGRRSCRASPGPGRRARSTATTRSTTRRNLGYHGPQLQLGPHARPVHPVGLRARRARPSPAAPR